MQIFSKLILKFNLYQNVSKKNKTNKQKCQGLFVF